MGRYGLLWCVVLFVLSAGAAVGGVAVARPGAGLSRDNPLRVLFEQDPAVQFKEDLEKEMATVSIIMGMLALSVAVPALVWGRKFCESVARLETKIARAASAEQLAELADESRSLHAQADDLRQCLQADTRKVESALGQWENRIAGLEQGQQGLADLSQDLGRLRDSQSSVESVVRQWESKIAELEQGHEALAGVEATVRQLESSVAVLEQGYQGLAAVARELEGLREFRSQVETAVQRLESNVTALEQAHQSLAGVGQDLSGLRDSQNEFREALQQWENRIAGLEQAYGGLSAVTKDLESLRDFRSYVEQVHAGIQKAFNGALAATSLPQFPDEETPQENT